MRLRGFQFTIRQLMAAIALLGLAIAATQFGMRMSKLSSLYPPRLKPTGERKAPSCNPDLEPLPFSCHDEMEIFAVSDVTKTMSPTQTRKIRPASPARFGPGGPSPGADAILLR